MFRNAVLNHGILSLYNILCSILKHWSCTKNVSNNLRFILTLKKLRRVGEFICTGINLVYIYIWRWIVQAMSALSMKIAIVEFLNVIATLFIRKKIPALWLFNNYVDNFVPFCPVIAKSPRVSIFRYNLPSRKQFITLSSHFIAYYHRVRFLWTRDKPVKENSLKNALLEFSNRTNRSLINIFERQ